MSEPRSVKIKEQFSDLMLNNRMPIAEEVLAKSVKDIADGVRALRSGRLNDRALILLIQNAAPAKLSAKTVRAVLEGMASLEKEYLKP